MAPTGAPLGVSHEIDDASLVARVRAGDNDALAAVYERHAPMVIAVAYRLTGSRADAEDVLHDVFLGLPEALNRYEERGKFESWIKRVAVRTALMRKRRVASQREVPIRSVEPPPSSQREQRAIDGAALQAALARLPDGLRHVFVLKAVEGYTHAEIGELLGIRKNTSEVRLHRAVNRLRRMLKDR